MKELPLFFGKTTFTSTIHAERPQALAKPYYVVGFKSLSEKVLEMVPGCSVAFVQKLARENIPKLKRPHPLQNKKNEASSIIVVRFPPIDLS